MNSWWKNNIRLLFLVYAVILSSSFVFKPPSSASPETSVSVLSLSPSPAVKAKAVSKGATPTQSPEATSPTQGPNSTQTQTQAPVQTQAPTPADLSAQVSAHNSPSDCWMLIEGRVYNLTGYFGRHPGGDSLLAKYCGKDATSGFNSKDSIPARIHSAAAKLLLQSFLIQ